MTVEELSEGIGLQDELEERGESRPRLAPGEYAANGYAHTSLAICTGAACMGGTCCNSCGGNAILISSPTFDPLRTPRARRWRSVTARATTA